VSAFDEYAAIVALLPVDRASIPDVPGVEVPKPSIAHTLMDCSLCGASCWVGPAQLRMLRQNPDRVRGLCYGCIRRIGAADAPVVALDPNADDIPRRT
jgi:hypothetical protein